nr:ABC transporter A family member 9-like [Tanacetum cinerariifolium]
MGIWLCGVYFRMHTLWTKCRHGNGLDFVSPPDGVVRFVLYDLANPHIPPCSKKSDHVNDGVFDLHGSFTLALLDSLFSKGFRTVKSISPKCRLGFYRILKGSIDKMICKYNDISGWVSLLALPLCLLTTFHPRCNLEYIVVVGKVLELIMEDGPGCGLHLNVDKTEVFWPKEEPRSRLAVAKTIVLMDVIAKIYDPQCDVLNYAFRASRLPSASLQTKLLRHTGIVASENIFDEAFSIFNTYVETDLLCNPRSIIPLTGLGRSLFLGWTNYERDIYGDHVVSCAGIIGIKHRHNVVHDTLVDICYRLEDMLLYLWDGGLVVCVDLTGSSPLTQTGMEDFVPGRAVIDIVQRKRGKYMAKCAAIGYGFFLFSFSSLGELEEDAVTLMKRI